MEAGKGENWYRGWTTFSVPPFPSTKQTLEANGYSAEGLASKGIGQELWEEAEIVINMSGRPREAAFREWDKVEDWDVDDPYGEDAVGHQRICEDIEGSVEELAERLRQKISHKDIQWPEPLK